VRPYVESRRVVRLLNDSDQELTSFLRGTVRTLAENIGERNVQHYEKLIEAQEFLAEALHHSGYQPRLQTYTVDGKACSNIEVEQLGTHAPEKIIVVGAHYDSMRGSPGANDNASGVAGVLALAKYLKAHALSKTIRFLFFVNEEPPFTRTSNMGSLVYAEACKSRNDQIEVMLSLETIGYFPSKAEQQRVEPWLYRFMSYSKKKFIAFVSNRSSRALLKEMQEFFHQKSDFPVKHVALPGFLPGVKSSDHWSFWKQGYKAVMVTDTAWARYPFYHTREDTPEKLNYEEMAMLHNGVKGMVVGLGNKQ
jgi:Zn-dependent M28 family amino/carboxypeptidase